MSAPRIEQQSLVLRHLAGLMQHGMTLDEALAILIDGLPADDTRATLAAFRAALHRGDTSVPVGDPFLTLLMRAETAGPEALLLAAESYDGRAFSAQAEESGYTHLLVLIGVLAAATSVLAWGVVPLMREGFGVIFMPDSTIMVMAQLKGMSVLSTVAFIAALALRGRLKQLMPGVSGLNVVARLRLYAAALRSGVDEETALAWSRSPGATTSPFGLSEREAVLLDLLAREEGRATAAEAIAAECETVARRQYRRWLSSAPSVLGIFLFWTFGGALIALYLPIFQLAGAIK